MPESNRSSSGMGRRGSGPPVDPRVALAQQYLKSAVAKLAEEESAQPPAQRRTSAARAAAGAGAGAGRFAFSIAPATYLHIVLATLALTLDALAILLTFHALFVNFVVGRVIALPTGVLTAAVWAYFSVCYLGVIESTSAGETNVDSLGGDWREWFWTLPGSLGMLAISAAVGWGLSLVLPINVWFLIAASAWLTYPIFQLSSLETGSPLAPLSWPVVRSLGRHPVAWFVVYGISLALVNTVWFVGGLTWRDPPYATVVILVPIVSVALFFYAWLLGQLAHLISTGEET